MPFARAGVIYQTERGGTVSKCFRASESSSVTTVSVAPQPLFGTEDCLAPVTLLFQGRSPAILSIRPEQLVIRRGDSMRNACRKANAGSITARRFVGLMLTIAVVTPSCRNPTAP